MRLIETIDQITPEWLTQRLQMRNLLPQGTVSSVVADTSSTIVSTISRLAITYSEQAPSTAPQRLFLKLSKSGENAAAVEREIRFYNELASLMVSVPLVTCYDSAYSEEQGRGYVLLDDLSETHSRPPWPLPPSIAECEVAVDCLAKLHAYWWEHPRLGTEIGIMEEENSQNQEIACHRERFPAFVDFLSDRLSAPRRRIYETVLTALPRLWKRYLDSRGQTIIHGDAHVWNFLFPHNLDTGKVLLLDWHNWHIGCGTDDLAYMIALHWYPERRSHLEERLVRRYHTQLQKEGVRDYEWTQCWNSYRLSVINNLLLPMEQWQNGMAAFVWWPHLERALLAFEDLKCEELVAS